MTCQARQCRGMVSARVPSQSKMRARGGEDMRGRCSVFSVQYSVFSVSYRVLRVPCCLKREDVWQALTFPPKAFGVHVSRLELQGLQLFLQVMRHQRFDDRINLALQNKRQVVEGQLDAMVGDAVLREIVGADALVALA